MRDRVARRRDAQTGRHIVEGGGGRDCLSAAAQPYQRAAKRRDHRRAGGDLFRRALLGLVAALSCRAVDCRRRQGRHAHRGALSRQYIGLGQRLGHHRLRADGCDGSGRHLDRAGGGGCRLPAGPYRGARDAVTGEARARGDCRAAWRAGGGRDPARLAPCAGKPAMEGRALGAELRQGGPGPQRHHHGHAGRRRLRPRHV